MKTITKLILCLIAILASTFSFAQDQTKISADSLLVLSQAQIYKNPHLSAEYATLAVERARETESKSAEALGLIYLGVISEIQADYEKGFNYLNDARELARENDLPDSEGLALMNIGNLHFRLENFDFAIRYFMDANRIFESKGNKRFTAAVLNNMAIIYEEYKEYDKALQYLDSAEVKYRALDIAQEVGSIHESRARIYTFQGIPEKAIPILDSLIKVNKRNSIGYDLSMNYYNNGKAWLALEDTAQAIEYYHKALDMFNKLGMIRESGETNREIAKLLSENGRDKDALEYMTKAVSEFQQTNDTKRLQEAYNLLGNIELKLGMKEEALADYVLANSWDDSLRAESDERMKDRLQISRNSDEQRAELLETQVQNRFLEEKANNRSRWLTITSVLLGISIVLAVWLFFSLRQKQSYLSELRKLNEENVQQKEQLEELNEVKTRMFSIIGHDLRSPLASLHGSLQLINAGKMNEEEKSLMLTSLSEAVTHTRVTIDNLFHWAREEMNGSATQKKVFDLSDVIDDTLPLYDYMMNQKGILFKHSCEESLPVFADRDQLRFVLRNLVHNAFKFTPHGGEVEVTCSKSEKGSDTVVEVRDTGVGIPKRNLEALKSGIDLLSSRGTQKEIGSGLGLKMCFLFMEQNEGSLEVESSEGGGTVFRIVLPAASGTSA